MKKYGRVLAAALAALVLASSAGAATATASELQGETQEAAGEADGAGEEKNGGTDADSKTGAKEADKNSADEKDSDKSSEKKGKKKEKEKTEYEKAMEAAHKEPVQTNEIEGWPQGPKTWGESGIVMDAETGSVLYAKNIYRKEYPASITKILTALLAFEYGDMDDKVEISSDALSCLEAGYVSLGVNEGDTLTMEQAMHAMLMASANEVAYAVGETVAKSQGQDYEWFLDKMNEKVEEIGGTNSNFVNTNGMFDKEHYTCAMDMALVAKELFKYPEFFEICQTKEYKIPKSGEMEEHVFQQKHRMLLKGDKYYYEYAIGGKTGYTEDAQNTLVTVAEKDGRKLVCVILKTYVGHSYKDTADLLNYGFENFEQVEIKGNETSKKLASIPDNACVTLPEGVEFSKLDKKIEEDETGDMAVLSYTYEDIPVGQTEVQTAAKVGEISFSFNETEEAGTAIGEGNDIKKKLLLCVAGIIVILLIWIYAAARIRRERRKRRQKARRRRAANNRSVNGRRRRRR